MGKKEDEHVKGSPSNLLAGIGCAADETERFIHNTDNMKDLILTQKQEIERVMYVRTREKRRSRGRRNRL
ncbi:hypothetical protein DsansV1_C01g0000191 [Dioscorea sansibarensis]